MRNDKGQSTVEMTFILPLLIMLVSAMLFIAYAGWQDLKVQQAANLAARIEGQEKVSGGRYVDEINQQNGFGPGISNTDIDPSINGSNMDITSNSSAGTVSGQSVYERMRGFVRGLFAPGEQNSIFVPAPVTGQNVDQVNVYRVLHTPHIPFFTDKGMPQSILLKGTAYGGEDPFMYALPRWGKTNDSGNSQEWRLLMQDAAKNTTGG